MPGLKSPVAILRAYAQKRVDESSLREVAEEVGMSFSGLRSFLAGTSPHPKTIQKIADWYGLAQSAALSKRAGKIERAEIDAAVRLLAAALRQVPAREKRAELLRQMAARIASEAEL